MNRFFVRGLAGVGCVSWMLWGGACELHAATGAEGEKRPGFFNRLFRGGSPGAATGLGTLASLTPEEMTSGLKEALAKGVQQSVAVLGRPDGFLTNGLVRIPLPEKFQGLERTLKAVGQEHLVQDFVASMNRAAEQAVPEAAEVFAQSLKQMTISDAKGILSGPPDAATQFFRRTTTNQLAEHFLPLVQAATSKAGVTSRYKQLSQKAGVATALFGGPDLDVDRYVTQKAMDGLFTMVAVEEKKIRENPLERSTDLLKKVFGAVQ